jgi:hypothetical protein
MTWEGKAPLDRAQDDSESRAAAFADIARRSGDKVGAKEMAMTRRPRDEDPALRAEKFVRIERRADGE